MQMAIPVPFLRSASGGKPRPFELTALLSAQKSTLQGRRPSRAREVCGKRETLSCSWSPLRALPLQESKRDLDGAATAPLREGL